MGVSVVYRANRGLSGHGLTRSVLLPREPYCPHGAVVVLTIKKPPANRGLECGRYWVRTSDLFGVNEALYH